MSGLNFPPAVCFSGFTLVGSVFMLSWTILPPHCSSLPVTRFFPEASSGFLLFGNLKEMMVLNRAFKIKHSVKKLPRNDGQSLVS